MVMPAAAAAGTYNPGDVAVVNAIIDNNGLNWTKAPADGGSVPADWQKTQNEGNGAVWSGDAANKRVTELWLREAGLTGAIDLRNLSSLNTVYFNGNSLTALQVSGLSLLRTLGCQRNALTSLDLTGVDSLQWLNLNNNSLTSLDVSGKTNLRTLDVNSNKLTSLNVRGCINLSGFYCWGNLLTSLDLRGLSAIEILSCSINPLGSLDLTGMTRLTELRCFENGLSSLDVSGFNSLKILIARTNNLTSLTLNASAPYEFINVSENLLPGTNAVTGRSVDWDGENFIFDPQRTQGSAGMQNFKKTRAYAPGQFRDVSDNAWFGLNQQRVIPNAYEHDLMQGNADGTFAPAGNVTLAQALAVAARIHSIYNTGAQAFQQGAVWYQVYVDYAIANGIIAADTFSSYTRNATRAEMAHILYKSLPYTEFPARNEVFALPDVSSGTQYQDAIFMLYEAGVLAGDAGTGAFRPGGNITRAEASAIISRVILPGERFSGNAFYG